MGVMHGRVAMVAFVGFLVGEHGAHQVLDVEPSLTHDALLLKTPGLLLGALATVVGVCEATARRAAGSRRSRRSRSGRCATRTTPAILGLILSDWRRPTRRASRRWRRGNCSTGGSR